MRVRITRPLSGSIDGILLSRFKVDAPYDVDASLACYLMAIGAAELVVDEHPAKIVPLDSALVTEVRRQARQSTNVMALAADRPPRKRKGRPEPA